MDKKGQLSPKVVGGIVLTGIGIYAIATPTLPYNSAFGAILIFAGFLLIASD